MAWINFLEFVYPVGSVYFSTINTSPASVIGGTWSQLTGGMLGLAGSAGVATAGSDGGSRKISVDQMPSHNHAFGRQSVSDHEVGINLGWYTSNAAGGSQWTMLTGADGTELYRPYIGNTGGGQDYIPAHTAVYAWKRTA